MSKLMIFDLDGTITTERSFYLEVYSGTLNKLIGNERGDEGLRMLDFCRSSYNGQGELALFALGIPFEKWAQMLIDAPLEMLKENKQLVDSIRSIDAKKVVYTGSPYEMARHILDRVGFLENDFDLVLGWKEPEKFPLKWSCSPVIFGKIIQEMGKDFDEIWSIGDTWETDLLPAKKVGAKTVMIKKKNGKPDMFCPTLIEFIQDYLSK